MFLLVFACATAMAQTSGLDLKAIDPSVSACSNFYQYACGNWRKQNPIPPDRARWGRFDALAEQNLKVERGILEKAAIPSPSRSAVDQKIGDFYASCMDESAIDAKGVSPIVPLLDPIEKMQAKSDLAAELARLQHNGVRALFSFSIRPDAKDVGDQIVNLDQGGLGLPDRDFYLKNDPHSVEIRQKYKDHVRTMFELLAQARKTTDAGAALQGGCGDEDRNRSRPCGDGSCGAAQSRQHVSQDDGE